MKQLLARFGVVAITSAILGACSGLSQNVTPSTGSSLGGQPVTQSIALGRNDPGVVEIDANARAIANSFVRAGTPHFLRPSFGNPLRSAAMHSAATPVSYPLDMSCQTRTCQTMPGSTAYDIYVTLDGHTCATESCWGKPEEFLKSLTGSPLAGVITQYTKNSAAKYKFGGSMAVKYALKYSNTFYTNDLFTILGAAVSKLAKHGFSYQYHLFLPPGIDTCTDRSDQCYSPDNPLSMTFCAYHTTVIYNNVPIVYSVEPYQNAIMNIGGQIVYPCQPQTVPKGTNRLYSGTASTLLRESMGSWSDPEVKSAWYNSSYQMEIGDVCNNQYLTTVKLGNIPYYVDEIYSNHYHGCASGP